MRKIFVFPVLAAAVLLLSPATAFSSGNITRADVLEARNLGEEGIPVLKRALDSESPVIRRTAVRALSGAGPAARGALAKALENDDAIVRRTALTALNEMGELTREQIAAAALDEDEEIRNIAREILDPLKKWNLLPDFPEIELPALEIRGNARSVADGPYESALKIPPPVYQVRESDGAKFRLQQGANIANIPAFFPEGEFSIELLISPGPKQLPNAYLIDTMAISYPHRVASLECMTGYTVMLADTTEGNRAKVRVMLGFGRENTLARYETGLLEFEPGSWHRIIFTYDGKGGGRIYVNGQVEAERKFEGKEGIHPARRDMFLGDRGISTFAGFAGRIGLVRLHHGLIK